mmetsp:Transcript_24892/g.80523  ORF Transcript_24892/g.80523 Transcript_24892/m.80523 type:complete len:209 (+) Transcript_24892:1048-1674(+)
MVSAAQAPLTSRIARTTAAAPASRGPRDRKTRPRSSSAASQAPSTLARAALWRSGAARSRAADAAARRTRAAKVSEWPATRTVRISSSVTGLFSSSAWSSSPASWAAAASLLFLFLSRKNDDAFGSELPDDDALRPFFDDEDSTSSKRPTRDAKLTKAAFAHTSHARTSSDVPAAALFSPLFADFVASRGEKPRSVAAGTNLRATCVA